ncbi:MAG TPA: hypothetical protein VLF62_04685, partial [Candidatus Saccharimonadales bacterium]|nr:hypothetical protein [Candidatus Saccharimonadales bacterium]
MSAPEAARAQFEYMAQGAEVPFVHIPVGQLEGWIQATEGEHLLAHREIDMAWLRMETAMTIVSRRRAGLEGDTELAPEALLDSAQDRLDKVGLQNANDPVVRSRAILASGSVGLYRSAVRSLPASAEDTEITTIDIGAAYAKQIEAAELLMRAATRRRGSVPLHDLHVQTTLLSLNAETTTTELIAMPLPSRLQEEGDVRSVDILVWDVSDARKSSGLYAARVSAGESALVAGHVVFGSNLLKNDGYPSEIGQGTLQAMIEQYHRRNMRRSHERVRHLDSVLVAHARHFMDQITCTEALSFETDPINGLSEARQWYHGISPLRNLTERDSTALEQCINPFENAYWARELSPEDIMTLAWLRVEMGNIFQRTDEPAHAEDLFTAIEERTAEQQD